MGIKRACLLERLNMSVKKTLDAWLEMPAAAGKQKRTVIDYIDETSDKANGGEKDAPARK